MPPKNVIIQPHKDHVVHRTALLNFYREQRGAYKTASGYTLPRTLNRDVVELTAWWHAEYRRARKAKPWHKDQAHREWEGARQRIARDLRDAEPDAVYKDNEWFWNRALGRLSIYLEVLKTSPSPTKLLIESFKETLEERLHDAKSFIDNTGKAVTDIADAVTEASEQAWSGIKIAAIVGGSLIGAAIVLPPVVRALRK